MNLPDHHGIEAAGKQKDISTWIDGNKWTFDTTSARRAILCDRSTDLK